jgi:hypothetical protein
LQGFTKDLFSRKWEKTGMGNAEERLNGSSESSSPETPSPIATRFTTAKGNFFQFLGIVCLIVGLPFLLFKNTIPLGMVLSLVGVALYGFGRFANWYFWYRIQ